LSHFSSTFPAKGLDFRRSLLLENEMNDRTTNLDMPFIMPSQAQKHVTHNEALLLLDAIVQLSLIDERPAPPATPLPGQRHLVAMGAVGAWASHAGEIAIWQDGNWAFVRPRAGWQAWFEADASSRVFDGTTWRAISLSGDAGVDTLGVSASADATNRLAVSSPASLFNHAGSGHQLKINKATAADTATLLFQSGWTGHAEMGLAGDTNFSIKVSNGMDWQTGLAIDNAGRVTRPAQPAVRAYRGGASFTPAAGQHSGMTDLAPNQGGFALGAAVAAGGNALIVPATGLYLLALAVATTVASSVYGVTVARNGSQTLLSVSGVAGATSTLSAFGIVQLQQGDTLTLGHSGSASFAVGPTGTNLSVTMI
jgi:hypothetical protein